MLRDHLAKDPLGSDTPSAQPYESTPPENRKEMTLKEDEDDRSWTIKYINVANVQPIVEAIDEDVSGFISIQEVNQFALSRPRGIR